MAVEIYSTDTESGQISVIRKESNSYKMIKKNTVGNASCRRRKFTKDGRGFVSNTSTNTVSEIDALTHRGSPVSWSVSVPVIWELVLRPVSR